MDERARRADPDKARDLTRRAEKAVEGARAELRAGRIVGALRRLEREFGFPSRPGAAQARLTAFRARRFRIVGQVDDRGSYVRSSEVRDAAANVFARAMAAHVSL